MAQQYEKLEVFERENTGTKAAKALRREKKVPAVFYYKEQENINLFIDKKTLWRTLHTAHHIFEVEIGGQTQYAMVKDVQYHPVTDDIIHIDLLRVRRDQKITITVPLVLVGESKGAHGGGIVMQSLNMIDVSCLPMDVPEQIELDITELELSNAYTVEDITVAGNVEIMIPSDLTVVSIQLPKVEEEPVEEELLEGEEIEGEEAKDDTEEESSDES
ncbi:MAG: 50S ribosomal protein L25 [Candidatus Marinimicrobia bacterium]|nr:50S ribosomal protein L25 [Candidatus Neomarinimicrobiota bacterium]MBL7060091.1 50S ribosomal protein L25 [Candidatus Neomarinimicrobiota bacterium]